MNDALDIAVAGGTDRFSGAPKAGGFRTHSSHLLILSARSPEALDHATRHLRRFLEGNGSVDMHDVACSLSIEPRPFSHRRCLVAAGREDAISALAEENGNGAHSKRLPSRVIDVPEAASRPVVFLFPGIGDHYVGMGNGLYEEWQVFRQEVDRCARILEPYLGIDIRKVIYPDGQPWKTGGTRKGIDLKKMLGRSTDAPRDQNAEKLNQTLFAQPALFTIEYALARLWRSLGITPSAMVGHSMGEYVAACLAGVLSLEDALHLIAIRASLVNGLPPGAMLAVLLPEKDLLPLLPGELSISLINGPSLCVVAGPAASVAEFEQRLQQTNMISRRVQNAHAFHSRMLTPIVREFEREVRKVRLNAPAIPYISNVTGKWITAGEATHPSYWAMHADHTARFSDALAELWRLRNPVLLEAGPGRTLGMLAMQHPDRQQAEEPVSVSSLRHHYENQPDVEFLLQGIGCLWLSGIEIQWEGMYPGEKPHRLLLPVDPFESKTCGDSTAGAGHEEPASELERRLRTLSESVLDQKGIEVGDNFFDLGAHSLMIAKLLGKIEFDFGVRLTMDSIIEAPSIRQLAALMEGRGVARTPAPRTAVRASETRTPLFWFDMHLAQHIAAHLGDHPDFVGIPLHTDETRALQGQFSMEKLASCMVNTIRGVQPEGPYCLGGWCNCGVLAYETAQQLMRQGSEVALVVMMDSVDYSRTSQWKVLASKILFRASQFIRRGKGESSNYTGHRIAPTTQGRRRPARTRAMQFDTRLDEAGFVYEPKPYAGHVVVLYPTRLPSYRDPYANWAGLVTGEFEAYEIKGTHTSMLGEAGAAHLAARIESCIAEVNSARKPAAEAAARAEDTALRTWIEETESESSVEFAH